MDMIHKQDAAYIVQTGRGYLQVGSDEVYECFQSGYSGTPFDEDMTSSEERVRMLALDGRTDISDRSIRLMKKKNAMIGSRTEFEVVKDYLRDMAKSYDFLYEHRLWLPVLKEKIYLEDITDSRDDLFCRAGKWRMPSDNTAEPDNEWKLRFAVGQMDDPANQKQQTVCFDFAEDGNIAVCGSVVSGKSTAMQTIAYSLINTHTPDVVNMYAIDFSSRLMAAFEDAPHFGGVLYENDVEKSVVCFSGVIGNAAIHYNCFPATG